MASSSPPTKPRSQPGRAGRARRRDGPGDAGPARLHQHREGKPFAPDARMKKILSEAAAVGNATVRALACRVLGSARKIEGDEERGRAVSGRPAVCALAPILR